MSTLAPELSIVIPAYNDERRLGRALTRIENILPPTYSHARLKWREPGQRL